MSTEGIRRLLTYIPLRLPLSMATQRPWSNRSTRCAREINGCAIRTSARRSRPTTTSLPGAKLRVDPSYRTVSAGGAGRLIGTNSIGTASGGQVPPDGVGDLLQRRYPLVLDGDDMCERSVDGR